MKWFQKVNNMNELRVQYKKLLLIQHPDNGGMLIICMKLMQNMTSYLNA